MVPLGNAVLLGSAFMLALGILTEGRGITQSLRVLCVMSATLWFIVGLSAHI